MKLSYVYLLITGLILTAGCSPKAPRNVILLIGDGMGTSQLTGAAYEKGALEVERCAVGGLVKTHSIDSICTDSAASGTALATGYKTTNGTIGQTGDGAPLKTALDAAEEQGKATGLVTTSGITHATPAAFAAHVPKRSMQQKIAEQIAEKDIEVLFGGGLGYFIPETEEGSLRTDRKNLLADLARRMPVLTTEEHFNALGTPERVTGLFAYKSLPPVSEGRISLSALTAKAISILNRNDNGFFLMVEGAQIDWGGHANDARYLIGETIDFDDAVGAALDFAEKEGNTLVIVTADHETGGFAVLDGSVEDATITKTAFVSESHTAAMVPLFAFGPGAEDFGGIMDNTDVGRLIHHYIAGRKPSF